MPTGLRKILASLSTVTATAASTAFGRDGTIDGDTGMAATALVDAD